jgi:hypothetical protein
MDNGEKGMIAFMVLCIIMIAFSLVFLNDGKAEVTPSEAPLEYNIVGIQRVDLDLYAEPVPVRLEVPVLEHGEYLALITDGHRIIPAYSVTVGNGELFCLFKGLGRLDSTVGVYLIWLGKGVDE